jgi:hypothetical protein
LPDANSIRMAAADDLVFGKDLADKEVMAGVTAPLGK